MPESRPSNSNFEYSPVQSMSSFQSAKLALRKSMANKLRALSTPEIQAQCMDIVLD